MLNNISENTLPCLTPDHVSVHADCPLCVLTQFIVLDMYFPLSSKGVLQFIFSRLFQISSSRHQMLSQKLFSIFPIFLSQLSYSKN
jgi:hypothetical protein